jgi:cleavage stimulation factor subunit 3
MMKIVSLFNLRLVVNFNADAMLGFIRKCVTFSADRARPLWERWTRYEYQYGDLETTTLNLEKRTASTDYRSEREDNRGGTT